MICLHENVLLHIQGVSREAEYRTLLARDGELQFSSHDFRLLGEDGGEGEVWSCQHTFAKCHSAWRRSLLEP